MPDLTITDLWVCCSTEEWMLEVEGSKGDTYRVRFGRSLQEPCVHDFTCTCPAFKYGGGKPCKHIDSVRDDRCGWHEQYKVSAVAKDAEGNLKCPKCGGPVQCVRVSV